MGCRLQNHLSSLVWKEKEWKCAHLVHCSCLQQDRATTILLPEPCLWLLIPLSFLSFLRQSCQSLAACLSKMSQDFGCFSMSCNKKAINHSRSSWVNCCVDSMIFKRWLANELAAWILLHCWEHRWSSYSGNKTSGLGFILGFTEDQW